MFSYFSYFLPFNVDELTQNLLSPRQAEENSLRLSNKMPTFTIEEEEEDEAGSTNGSKENVACSAEMSYEWADSNFCPLFRNPQFWGC